MAKIPLMAFIVDPEVEADGITAAYLAAHDDTLPARVPSPPTVLPTDLLYCMIDGEVIASMTYEFTEDDRNKPIDVAYPGAELRLLEEGEHSFTYRVERADGAIVGDSMVKMLLVSLFPALDLRPPTLPNTPDNALNPINALRGTVVNVAYSGMQAGQDVQVHWEGVSDDSNIDTPWKTVPDDVPEFMSFEIVPFLIAANIDATVAVSYTVNREGMASDSEVLNLRILPFELKYMHPPQLPDLGGGSHIEPDRLPNGLTVELAPWYLAFERQRLWLWCWGESSDSPGQPYQHYMKTDYLISADEAANGVTAKVPASWLTPLAHGSRLVFQYQVAFRDGAKQESSRVSFEVINR
ncbi:hypothetical protein PAQ31011_03277 [Pandoraea aquatica]|uniref:Uncharacterized protein n=1 Tax=Pandoraea aquatica TaxID=2508290 RepID=A0A5E4WEU2_9BURK|nr:hypothetical protein [Pandoraea aquatica]VVE23352.1 hypothetical protein PAQ31011_03277 [Pandoraea aquatica]